MKKPALFGLLAVLLIAGYVASKRVSTDLMIREPHVAIQDREIRKAKASYFRQKISYEMTNTGERVDIDYVFACLKISHNSKYDYGMAVSDVSEKGDYIIIKWFPQSIFETAPSGKVLQVTTLPICDMATAAQNPGQPHPFTMLHRSADHLSKAWGYATHHAYERENSELKFLSSSLAPATKTDFKNWLSGRKKGEFKQPVMRYGTFGRDAGRKWSMEYNYDDQSAAATAKRHCRGSVYYPLQGTALDTLTSVQPEDGPDYWFASDKRPNEKANLKLAAKIRQKVIKKDGSGKPYYEKTVYHHHMEGTPAGDGSGTFIDNSKRDRPFVAHAPKAVYPITPYGSGTAKILYGDNFKGLQYCQRSWGSLSKIYINDVLVKSTHQRGRGPIFDHIGGLFVFN